MNGQTFWENIKNYRELVGLVTTVLSVVTALFILAVTYQLAPVVQDIKSLRVAVQANDELDRIIHPTFATKEQYTQLTEQLNSIEGKVDEINRYLRK